MPEMCKSWNPDKGIISLSGFLVCDEPKSGLDLDLGGHLQSQNVPLGHF